MPSAAPPRARRLAAALARNADNALPLLFAIDENGHEYPGDLLDAIDYKTIDRRLSDLVGMQRRANAAAADLAAFRLRVDREAVR